MQRVPINRELHHTTTKGEQTTMSFLDAHGESGWDEKDTWTPTAADAGRVTVRVWTDGLEAATRSNPAGRLPVNRHNANEFALLVRVYRENESLLGEQRVLRNQIAEALAYWRKTGSNQSLAWARLSQLRGKHQAVLARLRCNRIVALELLNRLQADVDGSGSTRAAS